MSRFREMVEADQGEVVRVLREASIEPAKRFAITSDNCPIHPVYYGIERLKRDMAGGRRFFVLQSDERIVGCVALRSDEEGNCELSRMGIDPLEQRAGRGSTLLEYAVDQAASEGAAAVKLFLFADHGPLVRWFEKRGFFLTDTFEINDVAAPVSSMVRPVRGEAPPHVRLLAPGDEPALEQFLLAHLDSSAMLLSNLRKGGIVDAGQPRQGAYIAAFSGGKIVGVISLASNGNILPQAPAMLDPLARTLAAIRTRGIEGVVGSEEQATRITQMLSLPTGKQAAVLMDSHEYLYSLSIDDLKVPEPLSQGRYRWRRVEARDVPVLTDWMVEFDIESQNRHLSRAEVESNLLRMAEERDNRWVLESDEGLLATTGFNAEAREIVQVGGVYTPPALRSRGYARCAVAGSLLDARAGGTGRTVLFTAYDNEPAQRAYEAIGYRRTGLFRVLVYRYPVQTRLTVPAF